MPGDPNLSEQALLEEPDLRRSIRFTLSLMQRMEEASHGQSGWIL